MWETWIQSLGWEDPLEEGMTTHSSILAWEIRWTETGPLFEGNPVAEGTTRRVTATPVHRPLGAGALGRPRGMEWGGRRVHTSLKLE